MILIIKITAGSYSGISLGPNRINIYLQMVLGWYHIDIKTATFTASLAANLFYGCQ